MSVFRREDMVARIGGDEFVVLLPEAEEAVVENALSRIRETMGTFLEGNGTPSVSLSLGAATARESGQLMEAVRLADERMYQEKTTHTRPR
jgi:diguanylate cyclase (GGDEF)-like protein